MAHTIEQSPAAGIRESHADPLPRDYGAINAVYAEPVAPLTLETGAAVAAAVADLAAWIGAAEVVYGDRVPAGWAPALAECAQTAN